MPRAMKAPKAIKKGKKAAAPAAPKAMKKAYFQIMSDSVYLKKTWNSKMWNLQLPLDSLIMAPKAMKVMKAMFYSEILKSFQVY